MPQIKIICPRTMRLSSITQLMVAINPLRKAILTRKQIDYEIDMTNVAFMAPIGLTTLASIIGMAKSIGVNGTVLRPSNENVHNYLQRMDFYSSAQLEAGVYPFRRSSSENRFLEVLEVDGGEQVQSACDAIVAMVEDKYRENNKGHKDFDKEAVKALHLALSEIVENALEHGRANPFVSAQCYGGPSPTVEFSVVDCGYGFVKTMRKNSDLEIKDGADAIRLALKPDVSGAGKLGRGHGLPIVSDIVLDNSGSMCIFSDDGRYSVLNGHVTSCVPTPYGWTGSIIAVCLHANKPIRRINSFSRDRSSIDVIFGGNHER